MKNFVLLFSLALLLNGCRATVPDVETCSVAGIIEGGAICEHSNITRTRDMTASEFLSYLEPDLNEKTDGAKCMSVRDWNRIKTFVEVLCRKDGVKCLYEVPK